jgi:hypothetical protein
MSPEQITAVVNSWDRALAEPALHTEIAQRLDGDEDHRHNRAAWIIKAVTQLAHALDRPGLFETLAEGALAQRLPVSVDELAADREALLGALTTINGPSDSASERSWSLAIQLFAEIVASTSLNPFGFRAASPPTITTIEPAPRSEGLGGYINERSSDTMLDSIATRPEMFQ